MEWYSRREIGTALWNQCRQREVKWLVNDSEVGEFGIGIFKIKINKIKTYEEELTICER